MDLIILLTEVTKGVRHFFLLFIACLPRGNEIVRLKQGALLYISCPNVETVLIEHDGLADHFILAASLHKQIRWILNQDGKVKTISHEPTVRGYNQRYISSPRKNPLTQLVRPALPEMILTLFCRLVVLFMAVLKG